MTSEVVTIDTDGLTFTAVARGDHGAPTVFLLHGFPDHPASFQHQLTALSDAGYRAIAPVMRGYEPSSQPIDGDYSLIAIADDVVSWMDALHIDAAHLVGHDWGAATSYVAGWRHPERLLSLTAMAVPPLARIPAALTRVPRQLLRSWYMTWFQTPWLAPWSLRAGDGWLIDRLWKNWSPGLASDGERRGELQARFGSPGVIDAAIAYYRANATPPILLGMRATEAMATRPIPIPTLIMNGADDGCLDRRLYAHTIIDSDFPAGVRHEELSGCGHFLHLERPEYCASLILEHLDAPRTGRPPA